MLSAAVPLCVSSPLRPQKPAADFGQGCARKVPYHIGPNCKNSLKNRDYPTFPDSECVCLCMCACVFVMKNIMENLKIMFSVKSSDAGCL